MSPTEFLNTEIQFLKGVGPQRAELFSSELGIRTFRDLLWYFPFRYMDRTKITPIASISEESNWIQVEGIIVGSGLRGEQRRAKRLRVSLRDASGTVDLMWFRGVKWIRNQLQPGRKIRVFGKPSFYKGRWYFAHPEIDDPNEASLSQQGLTGVYSLTEKVRLKGIESRVIMRMVQQLMQMMPAYLPDSLSSAILERQQMPNLSQALRSIHFPKSETELKAARERFSFEELFYLQLRMLKNKSQRNAFYEGKKIPLIGDYFNVFYEKHLPFALTGAQKRVLKEIRRDMGSGKQMNRLLQGDVGSGKTIVALLSMLMVIDNGYQCCLMAPTEILASQHFQSLSELLEGTGVNISFLTGSTRSVSRRNILMDLEGGRTQIIVGTHALLEDRVKFSDLGLVVIDEQHRFGVEQRARLWQKDRLVPHVLVMTATPIPRTLAMTMYGDLDVSVIDELPPGRKPIKTMHRSDEHRYALFRFLKEEVAKGRQVYFVYPLIEESEKLDLINLMEGHESVCREFPLPDYQVSIVHGRMKAAEKDYEIDRFKKGVTQLMVATTVIEVGVNVPNASVMVIENAERFGLSQLHQLRGRVGRGAEQSYCILMTASKINSIAKRRIKTMCDTNDGFVIAEADLQIRGPGDLSGTMQSGVLDLKIADLTRDALLVLRSREEALGILEKDPDLTSVANREIKAVIDRLEAAEKNFSRIS